MMREKMRSIAVGASLIACASSGAWAGFDLQQLNSEHVTVEQRGNHDVRDETTNYERLVVTINHDGSELVLSNAEVTPFAGGIEIVVEDVVFRDANKFVKGVLAGVKFKLRTNNELDYEAPACRQLDMIESASAQKFRLVSSANRTDTKFRPYFSMDQVLYEQDSGSHKTCSLAGDFSIGAMAYSQPQALLQLSGLSGEMNFPTDVLVSEMRGGRIDWTINEISVVDQVRNVPFIAGDITVKGLITEDSYSRYVDAVTHPIPDHAKNKEQLTALQRMNAWQFLKAKAAIAASHFVFQPASFLPSIMAADFSAANLSTVSGDGEMSVLVQNGGAGVIANVVFDNLFDASVQGSMQLSPIPKEALQEVAGGRDLTHIPTVFERSGLRSLMLKVKDDGFARNFLELRGTSPARYTENLAPLLAKGQRRHVVQAIDTVSRWLRNAFFQMQAGEAASFQLHEQTFIPFSEIDVSSADGWANLVNKYGLFHSIPATTR